MASILMISRRSKNSGETSNSQEKRLNAIVRSVAAYSDNGEADLLNLVMYAAQTPHRSIQPPFLEVGTRAGGSALALLKVIERFFANTTTLITVDPYGDKPYDDKPWVYGNQFYVKMKKLLAPYANHIHYSITSKVFISRLSDLTFWWRGKKRDFSRFSFIYLDGSHQPKTVRFEIEHLFPRIISPGYLVVDNSDYYNGAIRKYLSTLAEKKGLSVVHTGHQSVIQQK